MRTIKDIISELEMIRDGVRLLPEHSSSLENFMALLELQLMMLKKLVKNDCEAQAKSDDEVII